MKPPPRVAIIFTLAATWATAVSCGAQRRPGDSEHLQDVEVLLLELVNQARAQVGASPLRDEPTLRRISRDHNADMIQRGYFNHKSPEGIGPVERVGLMHRSLIGTSGENIWTGSGFRDLRPERLARRIFDSWMTSTGHRQNILRREFTHVGVGVTRIEREIRATQTFASVAGWVHDEVPLSVREGSVLQVEAKPARGGLPVPQLFDLWIPSRKAKAAGPLPTEGGSIDVPPGLYSLRFYFETKPGKYTIYQGPRIQVE